MPAVDLIIFDYFVKNVTGAAAWMSLERMKQNSHPLQNSEITKQQIPQHAYLNVHVLDDQFR